MRLIPILVAASLLWTAIPALAADAPAPAWFAQVVKTSDPDMRTNIETQIVRIGYVDANTNAQLDATTPDETVYIDSDGSRTVTFGDIRVTHFYSYGGGSAVDFTNRDFGRDLTEAQGWFAKSASGTWYVDTNADKRVSPSDIRMTGDNSGTKVIGTDPDVGVGLTAVQEGQTPAIRAGWNDANGNHQRDLNEPIYIDLNFDKQVSAGDLRLQATGLGIDDEATRAELAAAVAKLNADNAALRSDMNKGDAALGSRIDDLGAQMGAQFGQLSKDLSNLGNWVLLLGLLTLLGLVGVGWYSRRLFREATSSKAKAPAADEPSRTDMGNFR